VAEPIGNPPGPPHAVPRTMYPLASDKIDAPAACAVPFRPYCRGVVTQTRNVSEYMLVLALCLVAVVRLDYTNYITSVLYGRRLDHSWSQCRLSGGRRAVEFSNNMACYDSK